MRYDDRKVHSVSVGAMNLLDGKDGPIAATTVWIDLTAFQNDALSGPGIQVNLGIPSAETDTLSSLKNSAVLLAYEMVQRLAKEPLESFQQLAAQEPLYSQPKA